MTFKKFFSKVMTRDAKETFSAYTTVHDIIPSPVEKFFGLS